MIPYPSNHRSQILQECKGVVLLWYIDHGADYEVILGWGYGGQFIYTVPELDLVVATTARWAVNANKKAQQELAILNHIVHSILPAYE